MSRVLMVASEATPFAKTGGLADVVGSLPAALRLHGHDVAVVLPRYGSIPLETARRVWDRLHVQVGRHSWVFDVYAVDRAGITFYLLDCPVLYDRTGLYSSEGKDYPDNHLRFAALSQGAVGVARCLFHPDIMHLHDWQSALCAVYLKTRYQLDPHFIDVKVVFTIHNLEYQGRFARYQFDELGLDTALFHPDYLEYLGDVNLMKGGIALADAVTTVSRRYADEIQTAEFGYGLNWFLRKHTGKLRGILNGVDYGIWNPETDPLIAARYSAQDLSGKADCKRDLLAEVGLPVENMDRPLLGIVSRMARQKGFDLLDEVVDDVLTGENACLVALGSGEARYEAFFRSLQDSYPDRVGLRLGYDDRLAHKIEAGADLFLMPSLFEPSGLNQMYSLRYGTIPIVRSTGGLEDSVTGDTGFKFWGYSPGDLRECIRIALGEFRDREAWLSRMKRAMATDFSWNKAAREYSEMYRQLLAA
jgi:starch synthase